MSTFEEYVKQIAESFPVSPNVFVAKGDERTVYFNTKDKSRIDLSQVSDPVEKLIANSCHENIIRDDTGVRHVRDWNAASVYQQIFHVVKLAYEKNCGLKNPRQSKMYRWLDSLYNGYNHESYEGFVALYRYIAQPSGIPNRWDGRLPKPHADNVIAVLERMRAKYEDK